MDVAHAILFARKLDISRLTAHYLSAKFELIKKNGDGYLITAKRYRLMNVDKTNLKWRIVDDLENDGGTAKDNLLNVPKTGGALTYNESDKTLKTMPYPTVPAAVMHKDDDGKEFERLKAELLAKKKAELEKKYPGIEITVEE